MNTESATRAVIYARISEDSSGEGLGVNDQLESGRRLAALKGWEVIAELSDNDVSALTGKHRAGYAQVIDLVKADHVDVVVVYQSSRLLRNRSERAAVIELFAAKRVSIKTVQGEDLDLSTAYGRGITGILGEFDTMESEVKSERVRAAAARRARAGRPNGSLGYGWRRDGDAYVVVDEEAAVVREVVSRLLAGDSLRGVTEDLNRRGIRAPRSVSWGKTSVKKLALRPSNVAVRVHRRGEADEEHLAGDWPALVEQADHDKVTRLLASPDRRTNRVARPGSRRHLLTWGLGACGVCGGKLRVATKRGRYGVPQTLYVCDEAGCVGRNEARVDELVRALVVERLSRPDTFDYLKTGSGDLQAAADRVDSALAKTNGAAEAYADGAISLEQMKRINSIVNPELEQAEQEYERLLEGSSLDALAAMAGSRAAEQWDAASISKRRMVVTKLIDRVVINRTKRGGPGFDPETIQIEWITYP